MGNLTSSYVFKALESYHYDLEETMEALNYALSYDHKNTMALTLMGRVFTEKLYNYTEGILYFKEVLAIKVNAFEVYEHYINVLLWNEDYNDVESFIDFALTVKGSDKAMLYSKKAVLFEQLKEYKKSLLFIKTAKEYSYNNDHLSLLNEQKDRVKGKMPKKKKKNKVAKKRAEKQIN
ncbi:hypothetical protein SAMN05444411_10720 [Lutibacter oricola]|uniref:Uncharacterized protein n=1 Tax=Lutibacter oricola TaxID=762486 RepID=A0A1H3D112_9FLAO|nr:hypothetical protein [Lutibacter oricola]SDX59980.1 hypothetical protein SAMN05444411_10720 [Lutibacter oricola]